MLNFYNTVKFIVLLLSIAITSSQGSVYDSHLDDYGTDTEEQESQEEDSRVIVNPLPKGGEPQDCNHLQDKFNNCTRHALARNNLTGTILPLASEIDEWCKSITVLSQCDAKPLQKCGDVPASKVIEETMKGIMHVRTSVCDNTTYLLKYKMHSKCIPIVKSELDYCLNFFKTALAEHRSSLIPWTHYENHFYLCCERALFRHCTLVRLSKRCNSDEVFILQKFIVVISERDFSQNCELSIDYTKCPGGDPRPNLAVFRPLQRELGDYIKISSSDATSAYGNLISLWLFVFLYIFFVDQ